MVESDQVRIIPEDCAGCQIYIGLIGHHVFLDPLVMRVVHISIRVPNHLESSTTGIVFHKENSLKNIYNFYIFAKKHPNYHLHQHTSL